MTIGDIEILRPTRHRQVEALKILFSRFPIDQQTARIEDTLLAVSRGTLDLSGLLLAEVSGSSAGAALVMPQADGISLVWPPMILEGADDERIGTALMTAVCQELDDSAARFGQSLLSPVETAEAAWLQRFNFQPAAELFFLARSLEVIPPGEPPLTECEVFNESENSERFAALIEQTYEQSLDCPLLNGRRTGTDALASHRLSGTFHPRGWRLYRQDGRDAAVLLLNEHPDQDAVELVYFGVTPEFRGQGLGRRVLREALQLSQGWKRAAIFLAVDAGNTFANKIYNAWEFQEVARRIVWLRFPSVSAQQ